MRFDNASGEDSGYLSAFNFSSLTDIVMLLLIFFLLTSSFVTTKGLDVVLPEAANIEKQNDLRLDVSLKEDGTIAFNGEETTVTALPSQVQEAITGDTTAIVVIRADKGLPYEKIIEALDVVKGAGATKFFLATGEESL